MAVNTALRRIAALAYACPWRGLLPFPDGTVNTEDRYEIAHAYSGLIGSAPKQIDQVGNIAVNVNSGVYTFNLSVYFNGATSYSIAPAVAAGWSFDTTTGILTVDSGADAAGTYGPYTVTATNGNGSAVGNAITVLLSNSLISQDQWDLLE